MDSDPIEWWETQGRQQWLEMIERMEKEEQENGRTSQTEPSQS